MSLSTTKKHLVELLGDPGNKVIALSGKWGTGKSHLWRAVKSDSIDERVKAALYVSLFGLISMDQVKLKIVQSAIPKADENPSWWDNAKKGWGAASKVLESFHKGFSALNEIALLAVPAILKDRVIVLDDIERKHEKLSVDEVMGFIDEFTQQHGARIVLILNSDQLADRRVWDTLREKVIDQEVRLETSPAEAFDIAVGIQTSPYADRIRNTIETCGLTNIRIICKVLKAVNRILGKRVDLSDDVLSRVVPSTVLLAAIHYKGIEDGPDFDFVLKIGNPDLDDRKKAADELDEAAKRRAKWRLQLQELGIHACDEYERLVVEFLRSGLFDVADVEKVIQRYASEADVMRARKRSQEFHDHVIWHVKMTESELLAEAETLVPQAHLLDLYTVSSLHDLVSGLAGGASVADAILDAWIASFQSKNPDVSDFDNFWHRPIHPRIQAELNALKAVTQAKTTLFDACEYVAKNSGWGHKQEAAMKSASVADFEDTIKSLEVDNLRLFLCRFVDMCVHKGTYLSHFGSAMDHFTQACRNISTDPNQARLGALIKLLFEDAKIESELNPPLATTPVAEGAESSEAAVPTSP